MQRNKKFGIEHEKKAVNRKGSLGDSDIGLITERLQLVYFKYVKRTKRNHV